MASFVEQATLKVVDQSSGVLDKITGSIQRMESAAKRVANLKIGNIGSGADTRRLTTGFIFDAE